MELTVFAGWLNDVFFEMDFAIEQFYHSLAVSLGWLLTPVLGTLTLTAWEGVPLILLAIGLICFRKTRRTGICCLLALGIGALFTNLIVKNAVARPRPYNFDPTLRQWWEYVGAHMESEFSFPSGHMTAACDFTTGFVLVRGKRWLPWGILYVVLMGASRNYLVVHYPSDVLGGLVFGVAAGIVSYYIVCAIYRRWGNTPALREANYAGKHSA